MRSGVSIRVSSVDRQRLEAIVSDPKSAQKHVWRAKIILLTDDGLGTAAIMAGSGKAKTCVRRHETEAKPFTWTADPNNIIQARNRGFQTLESIH